MAGFPDTVPLSSVDDISNAYSSSASSVVSGSDLGLTTSLTDTVFSPTDPASSFSSTDFANAQPTVADTAWNFICAPEGIEWTTANAVNRVDIFGTNSPPAISGTRGMREFNLTNALVEGFTRNKTVEAKVAALEDLLSYKSSLEGGYVNVPVYQVWANQKGYCSSAYWVLKSVKVKETMRDLTGNSTRAFVDVSFVEVPAYQVDSGMDQAPFSNMGSNSALVATSATNQQTQLTNAQASVSRQAAQPSTSTPTPAPAPAR